MSETNDRPPPDEMVTLRRDEYEALLDQIDEAEDRAAVIQHRMDRKDGRGDLWLTGEKVDRLLDGASPVTIWREKRGMSLRGLAAAADTSPSLPSEIEGGTKTGSLSFSEDPKPLLLRHLRRRDVDRDDWRCCRCDVGERCVGVGQHTAVETGPRQG
jgi:hypothetical protein